MLCSTYERRRCVYRILVWKPERKRRSDIMQLVTSPLQATAVKLVSNFVVFNVTFFAMIVKKVHM